MTSVRALPASWLCIDCGFNTAPGLSTWSDWQKAVASGVEEIEQCIDYQSEVYTVRDATWQKAGVTAWGGCLCIGCLENRLGRKLKRKDFPRKHPFNHP